MLNGTNLGDCRVYCEGVFEKSLEMYCLWIDLEICEDCEFEASTCASLALS